MTETTSEASHNNDNDNNNLYTRVGAQLRERREALGLTQAEVAEKLHLSGFVVDDIEHGRVSRLSGIYRRGYIGNYARLLDLDADAVLAEIQADAPPALQEAMPVRPTEWKFERYLKVATYILVTTVIVPPLVYFFIQGGSRIMERAPSQDMAAAEATVEDAGTTEGVSARITRALAADDENEHNEPEPSNHVAASALPLASNRSKRQLVVLPEPGSSTVEPAAEALQSVEALTGNQAELAIELAEDSWIEIHAADGTRLEYDLLRTGEAHRYRGEPPFRLLLGRANAVNLTVNGEPVVWEGHDRGDVARIEVFADGEVRR